MYLCTQLGFFCITRPAPETFKILCSSVNDLEYLSRSIGLPAPLKTHANADSPWCIVCHPSDVTRFLALVVSSIDYPDFESACAQHPERKLKLTSFLEFQRCMEQD